MNIRKGTLIALLYIALLPYAICSGTYVHMDEMELWRGSDTVVIGEVTSITSEEDCNMVSKYVEIEVERYLKNPSEPSNVVVLHSTRIHNEIETPDGTTIIDDVTPNIELGFKVGERVYIYLKEIAPDYYEVYGGFQGKYSIIDGKGINPTGRTVNIPATISPFHILASGLGVATLLFVWYRRVWLSERIVGVGDGN